MAVNVAELSTFMTFNLAELYTGWLLAYLNSSTFNPAKLFTWWLNLPELFITWLLT